ncbi:unnamed protein product [Hermetia illucens]|uniref:Protein phosphatase 1 regulatory subunit 21 N-terminal domain-containing protein n=1 Tax=Hermetia illucens TaxID=343691 RepID=A0A7R8Z1A4_HERIL|nr:myosin-15 [Hermetia illucens]CAD7092391.1 unnamed protein product [Hermetia illucens]
MESNNLDSKYQKLASEYSKLRAQASVLKKAVIDEQNKNSSLREVLRQRETSLRRAEQEVDSLSFRNKQLELRVASLQEDFEKEVKKSTKNQKVSNKVRTHENVGDALNHSETILAEELQKKIMENAQLTSLIDDKSRDIQLQSDRIKELETQLAKRLNEGTELERKLRREIDTLAARNSELETKLVDANSMIGSEDALSASGSDNTPLHTNSTSSEERIAFLEKEVFHWRTQYEILKISDALPFDRSKEKLHNGPCSSNHSDSKMQNESNKEQLPKEQMLYDHFSKKYEDLLRAKCMAESRLTSYLTECENFQNNLDNLMKELKEKDIELKEAQRNLGIADEDLATTRINYEEQISVLTEQVISLSEQLASSK